MRQRFKREIARKSIPDPVDHMTDDEVSVAFGLEITRMVDAIAVITDAARMSREGRYRYKIAHGFAVYPF